MKALVPPSTLQRKKKRNTSIFKLEMLFKPLCLPKTCIYKRKKLCLYPISNFKICEKKNMKNDCICKLMSSGVSCKPSHVVQTSFAIPCFDKVLNCNKI